MVQIREMTEDDVSQVAKLEKMYFSTPWSEISLQKELYNKDSLFLVAQYDDKIVGYCGVYLVQDEGDITNVLVEETYRNRGIASIILENMISQLEKKGIYNITLEVRVSNEQAIHLYQKYDFKGEGIRPGFYDKPREDAIIMWRRK